MSCVVRNERVQELDRLHASHELRHFVRRIRRVPDARYVRLGSVHRELRRRSMPKPDRLLVVVELLRRLRGGRLLERNHVRDFVLLRDVRCGLVRGWGELFGGLGLRRELRTERVSVSNNVRPRALFGRLPSRRVQQRRELRRSVPLRCDVSRRDLMREELSVSRRRVQNCHGMHVGGSDV